MSVPVCHRLSFAVAETPAIAMRFMALPEEARLLESRIRSQVDPALVSLDVAAEEGQATAAAVMATFAMRRRGWARLSSGSSVAPRGCLRAGTRSSASR